LHLKRDFGDIDGVEFKIYANQEEAFKDGGSIKGGVKGYYKPKIRIIGLYRDSLGDVQDTLTSLRHETLAHFGLNLFIPNEKMDFLRNVIFAGEGGTEVGRLFKQIKLDYPELANNEFKQAEEAFTQYSVTSSLEDTIRG
jgi:hypothetical protein